MLRTTITSLLMMFNGCLVGCVGLTPGTARADAMDIAPAGPGLMAKVATTVTGLVDRDSKLTKMAASVDGEAIEPGRMYFYGDLFIWGSQYTGLSGRVSLDTEGTGGRLQADLRNKCIDILSDKNSDYEVKMHCLNMLHASDDEHSDGTPRGD